MKRHIWQNYHDYGPVQCSDKKQIGCHYKQLPDNMTAQSNILINIFNFLRGMDRIVKSRWCKENGCDNVILKDRKMKMKKKMTMMMIMMTKKMMKMMSLKVMKVKINIR